MPMMKQNTVFATLAVLSCLGAADVSAQSYFTDRQAVLIGGSASFTSFDSDIDAGFEVGTERTTSLTLAPSVQFFITPGLALGGELFLGYTFSGEASLTELSVGPAISYFFGDPDSSYYPFVSGSASISNRSFSDFGRKNSRRFFDYGAEGGLAFLVARNVALTGAVFYRGSRQNGGDDITINTSAFGIAFGLLASIF